MFGRRKIAALVAEFLGAGILTLLILSVQRSQLGLPFFIAVTAGLAFAFLTFIAYRVSGAHFNPALTLALFTTRQITFARAACYILAQLVGGFLAYYVYTYLTGNPLQPIETKFEGRILAAEAIGAGLFTFGYCAALYQRLTVGAAAGAAGLAYLIGTLAATPASVALINPAVALGVQAFILKIYVLGPIVGALVGANLYHYLFAPAKGAVTGDAADAIKDLKAVAADKNVEVTKTTVTSVKPAARKPRASTTNKTRSTAKKTTRKKS